MSDLYGSRFEEINEPVDGVVFRQRLDSRGRPAERLVADGAGQAIAGRPVRGHLGQAVETERMHARQLSRLDKLDKADRAFRQLVAQHTQLQAHSALADDVISW